MLEAEIVSETFDANSSFTWLIELEDLTADYSGISFFTEAGEESFCSRILAVHRPFSSRRYLLLLFLLSPRRIRLSDLFSFRINLKLNITDSW
jgi:hypothetical protein